MRRQGCRHGGRPFPVLKAIKAGAEYRATRAKRGIVDADVRTAIKEASACNVELRAALQAAGVSIAQTSPRPEASEAGAMPSQAPRGPSAPTRPQSISCPAQSATVTKRRGNLVAVESEVCAG